MAKPTATINIHTCNDLNEMFFKQLISIIKNGIYDLKIQSPKSNNSNSIMTQKELLNWIKNDEEGCLSTIKEYLQKESIEQVLIVNQNDPQLEQSFLDTLFDALWYLATSTNSKLWLCR